MLKAGIAGADVVMMLRLQLERMQGALVPSMREYFRLWGLDREKLAKASPGVLAVWTHENVPAQPAKGTKAHPRSTAGSKPALDGDKVTYWGQPVAFVVGNQALAEHGTIVSGTYSGFPQGDSCNETSLPRLAQAPWQADVWNVKDQ